MKSLLTALVVLSSVVAMADIPRPGKPTTEPGRPKDIDATALNVLVYGVPAGKLADLKLGGNTLEVTQQNMAPGVTRFVFTSRQCTYGIAGNLCLENKQLAVTQTVKVIPDHKVVKYDVGNVTKLR